MGQMRANIVNVSLFLIAAVGLWFLLDYAGKHWLPKPEDKFAELKAAQEKQKAEREKELGENIRKKADEELKLAQAKEREKIALGSVSGWPSVAVEPAAKPAVTKPPEPPKPPSPPPERPTLIQMGATGYNLQVLLTTQGGAVQQVVLPKFNAADKLGREVMEEEDGKPTKQGVPFYLIPGEKVFPTRELRTPFDRPTLKPGKVIDGRNLEEPSYNLFHYDNPEDKYPNPFLGETIWKIVSEEHPDGGVHKVVFEAELGAPYLVKFRKTYTLARGDYHIGFKLDIERLPGGQKGKGLLTYQLCGPRGLPLEGKWFTSTYRVALIGWNDKDGTPRRQYDDANSVAVKRGGDRVVRGESTFKYMAVATQFFASGLAIDDSPEVAAKHPWSYVRATTEVPLDEKTDPNTANFDDMTVRAISATLDLNAGESISHHYVIYNGPAKVRLLGLMGGDRTVDSQLVEFYQDKLGLNTITDFHSPTFMGRFVNAIWWSDLVILFTNLMHWLLSAIHSVLGGWAMSIIVLTLMVRILLLYPSRKQTQMNLRMTEMQKRLAPQLEELKKKCGDDFHEFNRQKMKLMMENGMNPAAPLGGCLLLIFQMPVMMGLYFCLQESIFFRLEPFLWIKNLAAPDMTLWWTEKIPYISTPEDIGSFYYLGPFLNVLPLVAVGLMLWQQSKMMPPATDPNAPDPKTIMKYTMIMMAVLFYKVAAGLALYFIVGSLWGMAERKFFIKKAGKNDEEGGSKPVGPPPKTDSPNGKHEAPDKPPGALGRLREALQKRLEEAKKMADEQSKRQIRNDPDEKRRDRKKRRRK
jgi:YidC/Oxa1 family membrane protein insertase